MPLQVTRVEFDTNTLIWEVINKYRGTDKDILCKLARKELDKLRALQADPDANPCAVCAAMIRAVAFKRMIKQEVV